MIGLGTLINIGTIVAGSTIGVAIGSKLPERTNRVVTDALGLITLVMGGLNLAALGDAELVAAVGPAAPFLIIVGALLIGSIIGSLVGIEARLETFGSFLHAKVAAKSGGAANSARDRFIQGFVDASLIFAIGPLAILGAFSDGMGLGIDQLVLKSILDGFASIAFAASLGWGVAFAALPVGIWQGVLTLAAFALGSVLPGASIATLTATGGVLLLGVGLRLLNLRAVSVADMLPALVVAPILTTVVASFVST
ncbi:MAG: DUF554 family protein [Actinobacteria bacterium]|nr:DUF554 family protein [Actinomycetota bacterium]MTA05757.1 DUF554 family protein [Actinomycetota bacterium]